MTGPSMIRNENGLLTGYVYVDFDTSKEDVGTGVGADMTKRIAAPMVGGLVPSFALELLVYPAVYLLWKRRELQGGDVPLEKVAAPA